MDMSDLPGSHARDAVREQWVHSPSDPEKKEVRPASRNLRNLTPMTGTSEFGGKQFERLRPSLMAGIRGIQARLDKCPTQLKTSKNYVRTDGNPSKRKFRASGKDKARGLSPGPSGLRHDTGAAFAPLRIMRPYQRTVMRNPAVCFGSAPALSFAASRRVASRANSSDLPSPRMSELSRQPRL